MPVHPNMASKVTGPNGESKSINGKTLTLENVSPNILALKTMDFAIRGPVSTKAQEIMAEIAKGMQKQFMSVIKANIGDAQAMGQQPITYIRQMIALVGCPELLQTDFFPGDVKRRAQVILDNCMGRSAGAYTEPRGMAAIRAQVAKSIERRDRGIPSSPEDIVISNGASDAIRACLKLFRSGPGEKQSGVLTPVPQFPIYAASVSEFDMQSVPYYLCESKQWSIEVAELQRAVDEAKAICNPRVLVIINPGNPTGNVLTRENIKAIINFAYQEKLFIFADEVYQDNVYDHAEFVSFKRVMFEMGYPYNQMELASFYSCSKGYASECGIRGGYVELVNVDPEVKKILLTSIVSKLCPTIYGQVAISCLADPPIEGDLSYKLFSEEKSKIIHELERKAKFVDSSLNGIPSISCQRIQGSMYAFPRIDIPQKAVQAAEDKNLAPDVMYALELLESTGVVVVPGTAVGQKPGTYHFRTTFLPPMNVLEDMMKKLKSFHIGFCQNYS